MLTGLHEQDLQIDSIGGDELNGEVTVEAVSEATGLPISQVVEALERLRESDEETRLMRTLRELEEPLYRVERPGNAPVDPLAKHFRASIQGPLFPSLDSLVKQRKKQTMKPKDVYKVTPGEERTAAAIVILFLAVFIAVVIAAIPTMLKVYQATTR